jgi:hypothetical protein
MTHFTQGDLGLDLVDHVAALHEEDQEHAVTAKVFVGQLVESLELDAGNLVEIAL